MWIALSNPAASTSVSAPINAGNSCALQVTAPNSGTVRVWMCVSYHAGSTFRYAGSSLRGYASNSPKTFLIRTGGSTPDATRTNRVPPGGTVRR